MFSIQFPICLLVIIGALLPQRVVTQSSYDYGFDRRTVLKRQNSNIYATTGVHAGGGPDGSLPLRQEIRTMEQDSIIWTLYILGLDMLQYSNQTEMLSWYQIAGSSLLESGHTVTDRI